MKSAINGGLQLSVLDGWWAEAYEGSGGWAISGEVRTDLAAQDDEDGAMLHRLLAGEVLPAFYERDGDGLPRHLDIGQERQRQHLPPWAGPGRDAFRLVFRGSAGAGRDAGPPGGRPLRCG